MKKSIFNWMMAIALVATPMVFVSCGSDDDDSSSIPTTDSEGTQAISYGMSISATSGGDQEGFRAASTTVQNTMFSALYQAFGKSYTPQGTTFPVFSVFSFITGPRRSLLFP